VGGLYHHEDGHADEDQLNDVLDLEAGDALQEGPQHLVVQEPGDEQVQALKTVEADAAVVLTQDSGGSGTFYYVAAAINTGSGTVGTNAILLGDRIAPQNILIQNGEIIANYADRNPGEPMTTSPSVGVSKYFVVNGSTLQATSSPLGK